MDSAMERVHTQPELDAPPSQNSGGHRAILHRKARTKNMSATTEIRKDREGSDDTLELQGKHGSYPFPRKILQKLDPHEYSQGELLATVEAHDELYFHLIDQYTLLSRSLEDLSETPFKDSTTQERRQDVMNKMQDLEELCVLVKIRREAFADYENYLRLTSVPTRWHLPNAFG